MSEVIRGDVPSLSSSDAAELSAKYRTIANSYSLLAELKPWEDTDWSNARLSLDWDFGSALPGYSTMRQLAANQLKARMAEIMQEVFQELRRRNAAALAAVDEGCGAP